MIREGFQIVGLNGNISGINLGIWGKTQNLTRRHLHTVFKYTFKILHYLSFGKTDNTGDNKVELSGRCLVLPKERGMQEQKRRWHGRGGLEVHLWEDASQSQRKTAGQSAWVACH